MPRNDKKNTCVFFGTNTNHRFGVCPLDFFYLIVFRYKHQYLFDLNIIEIFIQDTFYVYKLLLANDNVKDCPLVQK